LQACRGKCISCYDLTPGPLQEVGEGVSQHTVKTYSIIIKALNLLKIKRFSFRGMKECFCRTVL
jgi:hypothetical protein